MGVFKRQSSPNWYIEFNYEGHTYSRSSKSTNKREAEAIESRMRHELHDGQGQNALVKMTVAEASMKYHAATTIRKQSRNLQSTTWSSISRLKAIAKHFGTARQLRTISGPDIECWKEEMLARGLASSSIDRALAVLRAILNKAKLWGALRVVPKIELYNDNNDRMRYLSEEEELRLLVACAVDQDLWDLVVFMLDTGCRKGDALQAVWEDVKWSQGAIWFDKTKTDNSRFVPLTNRAKEILQRRLDMKSPKVFPYDPSTGTKTGLSEKQVWAPRLGKDGREPGVSKRSGKIITDDQAWCAYIKVKGKKIHLGSFGTHGEAVTARKEAEAQYTMPGIKSTGVRAAWKKAVTQAKITDFHMHDLRHTFASKLARHGVPLYNIGELLGHKDPKMTKRYTHIHPTALATSVSVLNQPFLTPLPALLTASVEQPNPICSLGLHEGYSGI